MAPATLTTSGITNVKMMRNAPRKTVAGQRAASKMLVNSELKLSTFTARKLTLTMSSQNE